MEILVEKALPVEKKGRPNTFIIFHNPSKSEMLRAMERYRGLRGLCTRENLFVADADEWTHLSLSRKLAEMGFDMTKTTAVDVIDILIVPETEAVNGYGHPRPFFGWLIYTKGAYQFLKTYRPFARLMTPPSMREIIDTIDSNID